MASKKYYVIWRGEKTGVFCDWDECKHYVLGYSKPVFKSYSTEDEAVKAFYHPPDNIKEQLISAITTKTKEKNKQKEKIKITFSENIIPDSICVDAACSGNPGAMEYRGVETLSRKEIFRSKIYPIGTNNIGEFLAIVHALALLKKTGNTTTAVYSDSENAIKWVLQKTAKTNLIKDAKNSELFDVIARAEKWLNENDYENPIYKWNTEKWGEIPADFGRKQKAP